MKKSIKWGLVIFLPWPVLMVLHRMDSQTLEHIYSTNNGSYRWVYDDARFIIRISLWIVALVTCILTLKDFYLEYKLISSWKLRCFLWFLIIAVLTELPLYPCYAGDFEFFWKPFHLH
jgi:hypothetical protein